MCINDTLPFLEGALAVKLTRGRSSIVDDGPEVRALLAKHRWHAFSSGGRCYMARSDPEKKGGRVFFARELLGKDAVGKFVVYANGITLDCRRSNLAAVPQFDVFSLTKKTGRATVCKYADGFYVRYVDARKITHRKYFRNGFFGPERAAFRAAAFAEKADLDARNFEAQKDWATRSAASGDASIANLLSN